MNIKVVLSTLLFPCFLFGQGEQLEIGNMTLAVTGNGLKTAKIDIQSKK
ncbi:hypothetical protein [Bizionia sp.]